MSVRVLQIQEAYAEKVRAALTRREPAIRDFFDIDHAVRRTLFDPRNPAVLDLVAAKLSVAGNKATDLSAARIAKLRSQIGAHLRPVLRTLDYEAFDLQRVVSVIEGLMHRL